VTDAECVAFLQWALPKAGRRWLGYRKVRRRVCRRVGRRVSELGLSSLADYRALLERETDEWPTFDSLLDVTISRFYRDRAVFDFVRSEVFPALVERAHTAGSRVVRVWSAGCANGEEPYTITMMWELEIAAAARGLRLEVLATDIKPSVLERAGRARFPRSTARDLPSVWREDAFSEEFDDNGAGQLVLRPPFRRNVTFLRHDIRDAPPTGPFDLVLCRYQAFTYFGDNQQRDVATALAAVTEPGAVLVLGSRERPPEDTAEFQAWSRRLSVYQRR
jgi:chemotaxis protein methyltransferase CheR